MAYIYMCVTIWMRDTHTHRRVRDESIDIISSYHGSIKDTLNVCNWGTWYAYDLGGSVATRQGCIRWCKRK